MRLEILRKSVNNFSRSCLYPRHGLNPVPPLLNPHADPVYAVIKRFCSYILYSTATPTFSLFLPFFVSFYIYFVITFLSFLLFFVFRVHCQHVDLWISSLFCLWLLTELLCVLCLLMDYVEVLMVCSMAAQSENVGWAIQHCSCRLSINLQTKSCSRDWLRRLVCLSTHTKTHKHTHTHTNTHTKTHTHTHTAGCEAVGTVLKPSENPDWLRKCCKFSDWSSVNSQTVANPEWTYIRMDIHTPEHTDFKVRSIMRDLI